MNELDKKRIRRAPFFLVALIIGVPATAVVIGFTLWCETARQWWQGE